MLSLLGMPGLIPDATGCKRLKIALMDRKGQNSERLKGKNQLQFTNFRPFGDIFLLAEHTFINEHHPHPSNGYLYTNPCSWSVDRSQENRL
jgi:hypothetical protein